MTTFNLQVNETQIFDLVEQLPAAQQTALFQRLLLHQWPTWVSLSTAAQPGIRRAAAERGYDWDTMTEEEREIMVDDIVHEGRL